MNLWFLAVDTDARMDIGEPMSFEWFVIGIIISVVAYLWYTATHPDRPGG